MIISLINKRIGPFLLKHGVTLSHELKQTKSIPKVITPSQIDTICLLPLSKNIISIELHEDSMNHKRNKKAMVSTIQMKFDVFIDYCWNTLFTKDATTTETKTTTRHPKSRYELLQNYLLQNKSILLPNNQYKDIERYHNNKSFLLWLRHEYIVAFFDSNKKYQLQKYKIIQSILPFIQFSHSNSNTFWKQQRRKELQEGKRHYEEKLVAPSFTKIQSLFQLSKHWNRQKIVLRNYNESYQDIVSSLLSSSSKKEQVNSETNVPTSTLTLEQILKLSKLSPYISSTTFLGLFNIFCEEMKMNEIYTREYLYDLAFYLAQRSTTATTDYRDDTACTIVEIGNGSNGFLSFALSQLFSSMSVDQVKQQHSRIGKRTMIDSKCGTPPNNIITIDEKELKKGKYNIQQLIQNKCSEQQRQQQSPMNVIIICSWMPIGIDWSKYFRIPSGNNTSQKQDTTTSIRIVEYILIGPSNGTLFSCGEDWCTWGVTDQTNAYNPPEKNTKETPPPFETDGYEKVDLDFLSKQQYCKFDSSVSRFSTTISFRMKE